MYEGVPLLFDLGITRYGWRSTMEIYAGFAFVAISLLAIAFLQEPPKPSATSLAAAPMAPVKVNRVGDHQPVHPPTQISPLGLGNQMKMIR